MGEERKLWPGQPYGIIPAYGGMSGYPQTGGYGMGGYSTPLHPSMGYGMPQSYGYGMPYVQMGYSPPISYGVSPYGMGYSSVGMSNPYGMGGMGSPYGMTGMPSMYGGMSMPGFSTLGDMGAELSNLGGLGGVSGGGGLGSAGLLGGIVGDLGMISSLLAISNLGKSIDMSADCSSFVTFCSQQSIRKVCGKTCAASGIGTSGMGIVRVSSLGGASSGLGGLGGTLDSGLASLGSLNSLSSLSKK
ncbi:hypothetical protein DdX_14822 [Ditylenchus destructor]|uniref:Uncharacterized protein n=1 Tax=Ditylenchus destructor TaxID=166010 RepID=A0AAD4MW51_9BILA|nr:hypothetical protein DdX_14822 [Ditylenchus destructor]